VGQTFDSVAAPSLNDHGDVVFVGALPPGTVNGVRVGQIGIWGPDGQGGLSLLAGVGQAIPGFPSYTNISVDSLFLNNAGNLGFFAGIDGTSAAGVPYGFGLFGPDASGQLASLGSLYGNTPYAYNSELSFNQRGQFAFFGRDQNIYGPRPDGSVGLVVSDFGPPPDGVPGQIILLPPGVVNLNDQGEVAYRGSFVPSGSNEGTPVLLGPGSDGSPTIRFSSATQLPGAPSPSAFLQLDDPLLNNARELVINATYQGVIINSVLWYQQGYWLLDSFGNATQLAIVLGQAPGYPPGATIQALGPPALNNEGQSAFFGWLWLSSPEASSNPSVTTALFALDRSGDPTVLLKIGDSVTVGPGDERVVADLRRPGSNWPFLQTPELNDAGQVAFNATFTDGSTGLLLAVMPAHACGVGFEFAPFLLPLLWLGGRRMRKPA